MRTLLVSFVGLLALGALSTGCSHAVPLYNPYPIAASPDPTTTRSAILHGMQDRGWLVEQEQAGVVIARLENRSHTVRLAITYDQSQVRFNYIDSRNLSYRVAGDGTPYIHKAYNRWVENLANDISEHMQYANTVYAPPHPQQPPVIVVPQPG